MLHLKPTHYFLCAGSSEGTTPLNAFDGSLLAAGVGNLNLIKLSSILPPGLVQSEAKRFDLGSYLPIAYGSITSNTPQEVISAAVAVAVPEDADKNGVIMEYSALGHKEDAERIVRAMAEEAMTMRGYAVKEILSIACQHRVVHVGAAFAAVALYPESLVRP